MAFNPSPEVAVARDAAKQLGNVPMCILLYVTQDGRLGMASYGRTRDLCAQAATIGNAAFEAAMKLE